MIDLSPTQAATRITTLFGAPESRTFEVKRMGPKNSRMIETVCAFANSEGGLLAVDVEDAKQMTQLFSEHDAAPETD